MGETPAPTPSEIYSRAVEEGARRLDQSLLELVSTSFIAGFTVVFGIVALGIVEATVEPEFGAVADIAGALAFGTGVVFLVVGRTEEYDGITIAHPVTQRRSSHPGTVESESRDVRAHELAVEGWEQNVTVAVLCNYPLSVPRQ